MFRTQIGILENGKLGTLALGDISPIKYLQIFANIFGGVFGFFPQKSTKRYAAQMYYYFYDMTSMCAYSTVSPLNILLSWSKLWRGLDWVLEPWGSTPRLSLDPHSWAVYQGCWLRKCDLGTTCEMKGTTATLLGGNEYNNTLWIAILIYVKVNV